MNLMENIIQSPWLLILSALLAGYLSGSISFARILNRIVSKSDHIDPLKAELPEYNLQFESDAVSASVIGHNLGRKYGCLTAMLDMIKVGLPTFLFLHYFPEQSYYLYAALAGIFGHDYPLYHRFRGGRGESPMVGAMLVINWFGIPLANAASIILGYLTGSILVMRYGWYIVMIVWYWMYFNDIPHVAFMVLANAIFWFSMRKDLARFASLLKENQDNIPEELVSEFLMMGKGPGRFFDRYSLPALLKRLFRKPPGN
jgi:glycerol-3-phosphate acyltransferase PlsY